MSRKCHFKFAYLPLTKRAAVGIAQKGSHFAAQLELAIALKENGRERERKVESHCQLKHKDKGESARDLTRKHGGSIFPDL